MNPSISSESRATESVSNSAADNQSIDTFTEDEERSSCLYYICERWFYSFGIMAITFITIGLFKFSSSRHGETLVFTGVAFLVILSAFMVNQHQRLKREREMRVNRIIRAFSDPVYVVTLPVSSTLPTTSNASRPSKPKEDDLPPPYEQVALPPPSYESLQFPIQASAFPS